MRTAIFLGLIYIGDAINPTQTIPDNYGIFLGLLLFTFLIMDVVDFYREKNK